MNKIFGIFIITGLILITIGVSIDTSLWQTSIGYRTSEYETINKNFASDEVKHVIIDSRNASIRVNLSDNDEISLSYRENNYLRYNLTIDEGVLTLKQERINHFRFGLINFSSGDRYAIILNIPKNSLDKLEIDNTNGKVLVVDVELDSLDIKTTNAIIEIENMIVTDNLNIRTTNGVIRFNDVKAGDLSARTTNGMIEFSKLIANNIIMQTTNGQVTGAIIGNRDDYHEDMSTTNGRIKINGQQYGNIVRSRNDINRELNIITTNGNITIDFR